VIDGEKPGVDSRDEGKHTASTLSLDQQRQRPPFSQASVRFVVFNSLAITPVL